MKRKPKPKRRATNPAAREMKQLAAQLRELRRGASKTHAGVAQVQYETIRDLRAQLRDEKRRFARLVRSAKKLFHLLTHSGWKL